MHYVYCLQSLKNAKLYIGSTSDLRRRVAEHNRRHGGSFTEKNGPWKLVFYEAHQNKKDASEMELFYKTGYGREVLQGKLKHYFASLNFGE